MHQFFFLNVVGFRDDLQKLLSNIQEHPVILRISITKPFLFDFQELFPASVNLCDCGGHFRSVLLISRSLGERPLDLDVPMDLFFKDGRTEIPVH